MERALHVAVGCLDAQPYEAPALVVFEGVALAWFLRSHCSHAFCIHIASILMSSDRIWSFDLSVVHAKRT